MAERNESSLPPLLRLPTMVRLKIFCLANAFDREGLYNIIHLHKPRQSYYSKKPKPPPLIYSLLLTCRTIYSEVATRVYATHHVRVRYNDHGNIEPLRRLRVESLQALRLLTIYLNESGCCLGDPPLYGEARRGWPVGNLDQALRTGEERTQKLLAEWRDTWTNYIQPNIVSSGTLKLNFICDTEDAETAYEFARSFIAEPPHKSLAGCSVRLSCKRDPSIQKLAELVVAVLTGKARQNKLDIPRVNKSSHFRFLDLPPEIQRQILVHTDLVPPSREIEWNPSHGYYYRWKMTGGHIRLHAIESDPQFPPGPTVNDDMNLCEERRYLTCWRDPVPGGGCYCRVFHSACSTIYSCQCWAPPKSLFFVNRTMRQAAIEVMFSQNRIIVTPPGGVTWDAINSSPSRLHTSIFLKDVVPETGLKFIRDLELVFPPISGQDTFCDYCLEGSPEMLDWLHTLDYMKDKLNLTKVTIHAMFSRWVPDEPYELDDDNHVVSNMKNLTSTQRHIIQDYCLRILRPLRRIQGLGRFYVHIPAEQTWSKWIDEEDREDFEQKIEQIVLGGRYNASVLGKGLRLQSKWVEEEDDYNEVMHF